MLLSDFDIVHQMVYGHIPKVIHGIFWYPTINNPFYQSVVCQFPYVEVPQNNSIESTTQIGLKMKSITLN